jgi:FSR family fosmidomycin resistance protein-like MFS transporter
LIAAAASRLRLHPTVLFVASVHFVVDGYGNIFAPLLPLLIPRLGLSLAAAGTLTMLFQLSASVSQIAFGHLADRWRPRLLLMAGPIVSVLVLSFVAASTSMQMAAAILIIGGLGGAAFHPPAAALAYRLGADRPGLAMSVHITGGSLGFSLGPLLFAPFAQRYGLGWTPMLALPGLAVVLCFLSRLPHVTWTTTTTTGFRALRPYLRPLALLYFIVVLRTMTSIAFATFMPVLLTSHGLSLAASGSAVAVYLFASGVGGFLGGPAADRLGARRVIALSLVCAVPFLFLASLHQGWAFVILVALGGFFLQSTLPVNVTFGQALAPVSAATVSSLMMGFAWGSGGLSVPFVGMVADRIGIEATLRGLALVPLAAAALAMPLPARAPARVETPPAADPL